MSAPADASPLQPADLWAMVRRRRVAAGAAALLAAVAVFTGLRLALPPLYRAGATLTMNRGLKPVSFQSDPVAGLVPDQMVNTQRELLTSQGVLQDALAMGGLLSNPTYARAVDPVTLLAKRLRTEVVKNSWVISVTLDDEDPVRAEAGLQSVLDAFLAHQATLSRGRGAEDLAYVQGKIGEAGTKLQAAHEAERVFREKNGIVSVDPDHNQITARIQNLAERQAALDERVAGSTALLRQVQIADRIPDRQQRLAAYLRIDNISTFTVVGALQQDLFKLQGEEAELATTLLDKHPRLIEVRSHIAAKRDQLEQTIAAARASIEADNQVLIEQRDELVRAQDQLQRELNAYREHLIELLRLQQDSEAQQKVYDELLARRAQLTALAGYDDQRMVVDGRPHSSPTARGIGLAPLGALAALLAAAAGLGGAALADALDRRLRDAQQARDLTGLRLLAVVPSPPRLPPLAESGPAEPPEVAEAMRALATALRYALGPGEGGRVLLVASPSEGDGRSALACRLAAGIALSGSRALLVDGDLREPALAAQCGAEPPAGLAQLLAGEPEIAPVATGVPNLDLMAAGSVPANPGELLNSHCLPEWLAQVRGHYDLVVLDSPPLASCSDALVIGGHVDAVLLLVRAGRTGRADLAAALHALEPLRAKLVGLAVAAGEGAAA